MSLDEALSAYVSDVDQPRLLEESVRLFRTSSFSVLKERKTRNTEELCPFYFATRC